MNWPLCEYHRIPLTSRLLALLPLHLSLSFSLSLSLSSSLSLTVHFGYSVCPSPLTGHHCSVHPYTSFLSFSLTDYHSFYQLSLSLPLSFSPSHFLLPQLGRAHV